ncbi:MAG: CapA family protein [Bacillota bacterium]
MRHIIQVLAAAALVGLVSFVFLLRPGPPQVTAPLTAAETEHPAVITLAAVGDLLMHMPVVNAARDGQSGTYDFSAIFAPVRPYISFPDFAIANLETRLAGAARGYCGYPLFNTPAQLAYDLRKAGVDLVATANNHSLDMGWDGIVQTLDNLDAAGVAHVGTYRNATEKATPFIADVHGVRVAILNYTASTNGLPVPPGKDFAVNILDPQVVVAEARAARRMDADLVVAILHFGNEYQRWPTQEQRQLARELCAGGVDVIIGSHPHVVQPIERLTVMRNGKTYGCVVAYSLGNFISNQRWRYSDSGIVLYLRIEKDHHGTRIRSVEYLPVWVQKKAVAGRWIYRVLPVTPDIPAAATSLTDPERQRMAEVWEELTTHLNNPAQGIFPYVAAVSTEPQGARSPGKP